MKRNIFILFMTILTVFIISLTLTACGQSDAVSTSVTLIEVEAEPAEVTGSVTERDSFSSAGEEEDHNEKMGSLTGGVYENAYFGFGCEFDDNWTFYTDEELAGLVGLAAEAASDEAVAELLESSGYTYDMYVYADEGLVTINVVIEDLGVLYGAALNEDSYAELAVDSAIDGLEALKNVNVTSYSIQSSEFAGSTHTAIKICSSYEVEGIPMDLYQLMVCVKNENYMSMVTFTTFFEDITDTLAADFYGI